MIKKYGFFGVSSSWCLRYGWTYGSKDTSRGGVPVMMAIAITSWGNITQDDLQVQETSQDILDIVARLPDFKDALDVIPASTDTKYTTLVESNNRKIVAYVKQHAVVGIGASKITQGIVDRISDPLQYAGKIVNTSNTQNTELLSLWGQNWSMFDRNFLKAVAVKVQSVVDLRDRYSGLALTPKEAADIENDVRKMTFLKSQFSKLTSKRSYINGTTKDQKLDDLRLFKAEMSKASVLAKIVDSTVEDIPSGKIFSELFEFNLNPKDPAKEIALKKAIKAYKAAQIVSWRNDPNTYKYEDHFIVD